MKINTCMKTILISLTLCMGMSAARAGAVCGEMPDGRIPESGLLPGTGTRFFPYERTAGNVFVESISIDQDNTSVPVGKTIIFTATVLPETATQKKLKWTSDDEEVAVVRDGRVIAKKPGSALIRAAATDGSGKYAEVRVTVVRLIEKIRLLLPSDALALGLKNFRIPREIEPYDATNQVFLWKSDNPDIISVNQKGEISTLKIGEATIRATATDGSAVSASIRIRVVVPVEKVEIKEGDQMLKPYYRKKLTAVIIPSDAGVRTVRWISSNMKVATVDSEGVVRTKTVGETTITAISDDEFAEYPQASINVKVVENIPIAGIYFKQPQVSLAVGASEQLIPVVEPVDATLPSLDWKSGDDAVVSVNAGGEIKAHSLGVADIAATTKDGKYTASVRVIVNRSKEEFKVPHLLNISRIEKNRPFPIYWADVEDENTGFSYRLEKTVNGKTVIDKSLTVDEEKKTLTFSESGNFRLVVTLNGNGKAWQEISYELEIAE